MEQNSDRAGTVFFHKRHWRCQQEMVSIRIKHEWELSPKLSVLFRYYLLGVRFVIKRINCHFNLFSTIVPLLYPLKTSKSLRFLIFSGGIEVEHWLKIDQKCLRTYLPLFHLFCYQQYNTTTLLVYHSPEIEDCFRKTTLRCNIFVFNIPLQKKDIHSMIKITRQENQF